MVHLTAEAVFTLPLPKRFSGAHEPALETLYAMRVSTDGRTTPAAGTLDNQPAQERFNFGNQRPRQFTVKLGQQFVDVRDRGIVRHGFTPPFPMPPITL
jgi:hypothetical protein